MYHVRNLNFMILQSIVIITIIMTTMIIVMSIYTMLSDAMTVPLHPLMNADSVSVYQAVSDTQTKPA